VVFLGSGFVLAEGSALRIWFRPGMVISPVSCADLVSCWLGPVVCRKMFDPAQRNSYLKLLIGNAGGVACPGRVPSWISL
jgi:hypothetical protein